MAYEIREERAFIHALKKKCDKDYMDNDDKEEINLLFEMVNSNDIENVGDNAVETAISILNIFKSRYPELVREANNVDQRFNDIPLTQGPNYLLTGAYPGRGSGPPNNFQPPKLPRTEQVVRFQPPPTADDFENLYTRRRPTSADSNTSESYVRNNYDHYQQPQPQQEISRPHRNFDRFYNQPQKPAQFNEQRNNNNFQRCPNPNFNSYNNNNEFLPGPQIRFQNNIRPFFDLNRAPLPTRTIYNDKNNYTNNRSNISPSTCNNNSYDSYISDRDRPSSSNSNFSNHSHSSSRHSDFSDSRSNKSNFSNERNEYSNKPYHHKPNRSDSSDNRERERPSRSIHPLERSDRGRSSSNSSHSSSKSSSSRHSSSQPSSRQPSSISHHQTSQPSSSSSQPPALKKSISAQERSGSSGPEPDRTKYDDPRRRSLSSTSADIVSQGQPRRSSIEKRTTSQFEGNENACGNIQTSATVTVPSSNLNKLSNEKQNSNPLKRKSTSLESSSLDTQPPSARQRLTSAAVNKNPDKEKSSSAILPKLSNQQQSTRLINLQSQSKNVKNLKRKPSAKELRKQQVSKVKPKFKTNQTRRLKTPTPENSDSDNEEDEEEEEERQEDDDEEMENRDTEERKSDTEESSPNSIVEAQTLQTRADPHPPLKRTLHTPALPLPNRVNRLRTELSSASHPGRFKPNQLPPKSQILAQNENSINPPIFKVKKIRQGCDKEAVEANRQSMDKLERTKNILRQGERKKRTISKESLFKRNNIKKSKFKTNIIRPISKTKSNENSPATAATSSSSVVAKPNPIAGPAKILPKNVGNEIQRKKSVENKNNANSPSHVSSTKKSSPQMSRTTVLTKLPEKNIEKKNDTSLSKSNKNSPATSSAAVTNLTNRKSKPLAEPIKILPKNVGNQLQGKKLIANKNNLNSPTINSSQEKPRTIPPKLPAKNIEKKKDNDNSKSSIENSSTSATVVTKPKAIAEPTKILHQHQGKKSDEIKNNANSPVSSTKNSSPEVSRTVPPKLLDNLNIEKKNDNDKSSLSSKNSPFKNDKNSPAASSAAAEPTKIITKNKNVGVGNQIQENKSIENKNNSNSPKENLPSITVPSKLPDKNVEKKNDTDNTSLSKSNENSPTSSAAVVTSPKPLDEPTKILTKNVGNEVEQGKKSIENKNNSNSPSKNSPPKLLDKNEKKNDVNNSSLSPSKNNINSPAISSSAVITKLKPIAEPTKIPPPKNVVNQIQGKKPNQAPSHLMTKEKIIQAEKQGLNVSSEPSHLMTKKTLSQIEEEQAPKENPDNILKESSFPLPSTSIIKTTGDNISSSISALTLKENMQTTFTFSIVSYMCYLCSTDYNSHIHFVSSEKMLDHIKTKHPQYKKTIFSCHICKESKLINTPSLIKHYSNEHGLFNFHCIFCEYGSNNLEDFDKHMDNHPDKPKRVFNREKESVVKIV